MATFSVSNVSPGIDALPTVDAQVHYPSRHGMSDTPPVLRDGHRHGFINAAVTAFAQHRPLSLKPDHFWLLVMHAVSTHVGLNAEELRPRFVTHDGKKALIIEKHDFVLGSEGNDWESVVHMFCDAIKNNTVDGVADMALPKFSTTTLLEETVAMATLMKTTEKYFDFVVITFCGIPSITLEGSPTDWYALRHGIQTYVEATCLPDFISWYLPIVLPVLDRLAQTSEAVHAGRSSEVDVTFWESFVKRGSTLGSGSGTYISGWINAFFPFTTKDQLNPACTLYSPDWANKVIDEGADKMGISQESFPSGLTDVPVLWIYYWEHIPLTVSAGFLGASQDTTTMTLSPACVWVVMDEKK